MATINLLFKDHYSINEKIKVVIPTVEQVLDNHDSYYSLVSLFTASPVDMMVQLDDAGIDFAEINDYQLFLLLFPHIRTQDTSLLFGELDLTNFNLATNEENDEIVLLDSKNDIVIDRAIHGQIAATLRKIHHLSRNKQRPANDEAKKFMLERARIKMKRNRNRSTHSELESLIVAMVNTEQYKYNFETTKQLSIYQFNESVYQIVRKIEYEHRMHGVYAGTISVKDLSKEDLDWITHK